MPTVPGCTEHHLKLTAILDEARKRHKSLCICWLDIANAYGSVHHNLIQFSLQHYHAPPEFCAIIKALYSGLQAKVLTSEWETPAFPLQIGVYQGDPLSVVIFNTVMNTLVDTLQSRLDLGYHISNSKHKVNVLQYADDTCLVADSPASCQHLLTLSSDWLQWANMKAKVPKCHCLSLKGSTSRLSNPHLTLDGVEVPFSQSAVRFLGLNIQVPHDNTNTKLNLLSSLSRMMEVIDTSLVTRKQKLLLYRAGVCPRLSWPLLTEELPTTWLEREMDTRVTRFLKKWSGLSKSVNTALLYLPQPKGGLNLRLPSTLYKALQVSRQSQLLTSRDHCVRHLAERNLRQELLRTRKKFLPAALVRSTLADNPDHNKKSLSKAAKAKVLDIVSTDHLKHLQSLDRQGQLSRSLHPKCASIWASVVQHLPDTLMKFSLNAAVDMLPHNSNLFLWKKKESPACMLCQNNQTLLHVLNNCPVARDLRCYNARHDAVLSVLASVIQETLSSPTTFTVDIGDQYNFPLHITPTDLQPDMVWWNDTVKSLYLMELTVCFESNFDDAAKRKLSKYNELSEQAKHNGYSTTLLAIQMGSRGVPDYPSFQRLAKETGMSREQLSRLIKNATKAALTESYSIWCFRNRHVT